MFIRLGDTKINYRTASTNKYMIFSEVVNSALSYETPVVINTIAELNALFSKDFDDYIYLKRLLETYGNLGLYLYKPLSPVVSNKEGFIDYESYTVINPYTVFIPGEDYIDYFTEWKETTGMALQVFRDSQDYSKGIKYLVYLGGGQWQEIQSPVSVFKGEAVTIDKLSQFEELRDSDEVCIKLGNDLWVYCDSFGFIAEKELPQNLADVKNSESLDNRSTLFIPETTDLDYVQPEYKTGKGLGIFTYSGLPKLSLSDINTEKIRNTRETLALRFSGSFEGDGTLGFLIVSGGKRIPVTITTSSTPPAIFNESAESKILSCQNLKEELKTRCREIDNKLEVIEDKNGDLVLCGKAFIDVGYNTFTDSNITPDFNVSQSIIFNSLDNTKGVQIWSKTIGGTDEFDEDGVIKVQIEKSTEEDYLIIISRYDYIETFQGKIVNEVGVDRLDHIVSRESKLIYMQIKGEVKTGTYYLSRGTYTKNYLPRDWMNSLEAMFGDDTRDIKSDFLLIPNIRDYTTSLTGGRDSSYYPEYETILDYCVKGNFQALIQNNDSEYKYKKVSKLSEVEIEENTIYHVYNDLETDYTSYFEEFESLYLSKSATLTYNTRLKDSTYEGKSVRTIVFSENCTKEETVKVGPYTLGDNIDWVTLNSTTGTATVKKNTGKIRAAIIKAVCTYEGNNYVKNLLLVQKGKDYKANLAALTMYSSGGTENISTATGYNLSELVECYLASEVDWATFDPSSTTLTFEPNYETEERAVLVYSRWKRGEVTEEYFIMVSQFGSNYKEVSLECNPSLYMPLLSRTNSATVTPMAPITLKVGESIISDIELTYILNENFGWTNYFYDGYALQFKNDSAFSQNIIVPFRDLGTVGNCEEQNFIVEPGEVKEIKVVKAGPNLFSWKELEVVENGYWISDENGNLSKYFDQEEITEAFYGGDYCYNYTGDTTNRLIYFYRPVYTRFESYKYPGYCIFLDGIMTGNYSGKVDYIMYNPPVENPYIEEPIESVLEKYRSNYLVYDGIRYYYKKYLEPENKVTSIFLRFVLGKITREIFKRKNKFIGEKIMGRIKQAIVDTLLEIESNFSIIDHVRLAEFESNLSSNTVNIKISTAVKTLVDKNIVLNITLNLNR